MANKAFVLVNRFQVSPTFQALKPHICMLSSLKTHHNDYVSISVWSISKGVTDRLSHKAAEPQREQLEQMGKRWMKGRWDRAGTLIFKQWTCMLLRPAGKRIKSKKSNRLLRQWNQKTGAQNCRGLSNTVLYNLANLISAVSRRWCLFTLNISLIDAHKAAAAHKKIEVLSSGRFLTG